MDEVGVLWVGGRLNRAELPYDAVHLMILPKKHHITGLIVAELHHRHHREIADNQQCNNGTIPEVKTGDADVSVCQVRTVSIMLNRSSQK